MSRSTSALKVSTSVIAIGVAIAAGMPSVAVGQTVDLTNDVFGATVNLPNATFPDVVVDEVILNNTDIAGDFILGTAGDPLSYTIDNGAGTGLLIENGSSISGDIVNNGIIIGSGEGVSIDSSTVDGMFINLGTISGGTGFGFEFSSGSDFNGFSNSGLIESQDSFGVFISTGGDLNGGFVNTGVVLAPDAEGVQISVDGDFNGGFTNSGTVLSDTAGVEISVGGDFSGGILNSGTIIDQDSEGFDLDVGGSLSGGFTNSGVIVGDSVAVAIDVNDHFEGGFTNSGTIRSRTSYGVSLSVGGDFTGGFTNSGTILAPDYEGVVIDVDGAYSGGFTNSGLIDSDTLGVSISVGGDFSGGILNSGTIDDRESEGFVLSTDGSLIGGFTNTGLISADDNAVELDIAGDFTNGFTNTGTITSRTDYGVSISLGGDFFGGFTNSGLISGSDDAVEISVDGDFNGGFTNSGTLFSFTWDGVSMAVGGDFNGGFTNSGTIDASLSEEGVVISTVGDFNGGFHNSGLITADDTAIYLSIGGGFSDGFTNTGTIASRTSYGVYIEVDSAGTDYDGGFTNTGLIESDDTAVYITAPGGILGGITNTGTIDSRDDYGVYLETDADIAGGFTNTGLINSSDTGVYASSGGSISGGFTNTGTISSRTDNGVELNVDSSFVGGFTNTGLISGSDAAVYISIGDDFTGGFTNTGTIDSQTSYGVSIFVGGDLMGGFTNSGTILAPQYEGVVIDVDDAWTGGFTNSGTIMSDTLGVSISVGGDFTGDIVNSGTIDDRLSEGFILSTDGSLIGGFTNSGLISSDSDGVILYVDDDYTGGFTNSGTIGNRESEAVSITVGNDFSGGFTNSGLIEAPGYTAVVVRVAGDASGGFTNSGTILSDTDGVRYSVGGDFSGGFHNSGTVIDEQSRGYDIDIDGTLSGGFTNSGLITAEDTGVYISVGGDFIGGFTNSGSISARTNDGVFINVDGPGDVFLHTSGVIEGGESGIELITVGGASLEIGGLVDGANGTAVDLVDVDFGGTDAIRVELQPGFEFDGIVDARNAVAPSGNLLVFGGPSGEAVFDLTTLDDGDLIVEPGEIFFGFEPELLKEDDANFILTNTNPIPFDSAAVTGGLLVLDDGANLVMDGTAPPLSISAGAGFGAIGAATLTGDVLNEGAIVLSNGGPFDPIAGLDGDDDVLTITGDYAAASDVYLDTFLNDGVVDITDKLVVVGDTSGTTGVTVTNTGGPGGFTGTGPTDGILIVEVGGVSDGDFILSNDVIAGLYLYDLVQADGQNWYLQSSDFVDQAYVYESLPSGMQVIGSALVGQLVERVGVRSAVPSTVTDAAGNPVAGGGPVDSALWVRGGGAWLDSSGDLESTTGASFDQTIGFVQAGGEVVVAENASGRLLIGALGHWGTSSMDVDGTFGGQRGSADFDFYGGGLTATWYGTNGLYFDAVAQYTAYDIDISTTSRFSNTSTDGEGIAVSGEAGYRIPISPTAALVPQGQLIWQSVDFDDFVDPDGVAVSLEDGDSLVGRLGVAAENSWNAGGNLLTGYAEANVLYEFMGDNSVVGSGTTVSQDLGGGAVEFGVGGTVAFGNNVSLYGEVDYTIPFDNGVEGLQALAGLRYTFASPPPPPPPPAPVIEPVAETAFIVFFDWDRADLTPEANLVLDDVVVVANETGYASIRLDGYTDLSGSAQYNLGLSERRANSVADGLIARGIAPDEIVIRAFGEENPLVPTPDGVREPQNRRVEIFLS